MEVVLVIKCCKRHRHARGASMPRWVCQRWAAAAVAAAVAAKSKEGDCVEAIARPAAALRCMAVVVGLATNHVYYVCGVDRGLQEVVWV